MTRARTLVLISILGLTLAACGSKNTPLDGDGGTGDGNGGTVDGPPGGGADARIDANLSTCDPSKPQCSNGCDDDNDGFIDGDDPECTGGDRRRRVELRAPASRATTATRPSRTASSTATAATAAATAKSTCAASSTDPNCPAEHKNPPFDPSACAPDQACIDYCAPLTPPGCDCFGCCTVCDGAGCVDIYTTPGDRPRLRLRGHPRPDQVPGVRQEHDLRRRRLRWRHLRAVPGPGPEHAAAELRRPAHLPRQRHGVRDHSRLRRQPVLRQRLLHRGRELTLRRPRRGIPMAQRCPARRGHRPRCAQPDLAKENRCAPLIVIATFTAGLAAACGGNNTCDPIAQTGCDNGEVCENTTDGSSACYAPVELQGRVFDLADDSAIAGAHVVALDTSGAPVGNVATTADDGTYSLPVPSTRNPDGTPVAVTVTLRADAAGYQSFPGGVRQALPVDTSAATRSGDGYVVQTALTDVGMIAEPGGTGTGSIQGTVDVPDDHAGVLVVAEDGSGKGVGAIADRSGAYTIFNLAAGDFTVTAYARGHVYDSAHGHGHRRRRGDRRPPPDRRRARHPDRLRPTSSRRPGPA